MSIERTISAALKRLVESFGGDFDDDGFVIHADAPRGFVWKTPGLHMLVAEYRQSSRSPLERGRVQDAVRDMAERVKDGVARCTAAACDYCEGR